MLDGQEIVRLVLYCRRFVNVGTVYMILEKEDEMMQEIFKDCNKELRVVDQARKSCGSFVKESVT